ncbi:MAG TPA: hypothetical protein VHF58_04770 [Solirubrobacterales bacterium]|nr:hypothetical protein [Solirubrobacterales bacterium]
MEEVLPGIFHWSAPHPNTGGIAHSYLLAESRTVLDPMASEEALELMREHRPDRVVLTNRHHYRESGSLVEEFGIPVLCPEPGLHEFAGGDRRVEPYSYGEVLAPGVIVHELGAICPDDAAIEIRADRGVLAFADGLIRRDGELGFVSDGLLGDDPDEVKEGLRASLRRLTELEFDAMLFAHGEPLASGAKERLLEFLGD